MSQLNKLSPGSHCRMQKTSQHSTVSLTGRLMAASSLLDHREADGSKKVLQKPRDAQTSGEGQIWLLFNFQIKTGNYHSNRQPGLLTLCSILFIKRVMLRLDLVLSSAWFDRLSLVICTFCSDCRGQVLRTSQK